MIVKKIKSTLNSIIAIKRQTWYYTMVNFGINIIRVFKMELMNMLIIFKVCTQILFKINEHDDYLKKNHLSVISFLITNYKKDNLLFLIKNFYSKLFLKSKIKHNEENSASLKNKLQIKYFLKFLMKLKNLYKKNFGIKFKKKKRKLFVVYTNINHSKSSDRLILHLKKKKEKKSYYVKTIYSDKKNTLSFTLDSKSLTQLLIYTRNFFY
jgi:hypothetical protein